jgi:hypothetical protein
LAARKALSLQRIAHSCSGRIVSGKTGGLVVESNWIDDVTAGPSRSKMDRSKDEIIGKSDGVLRASYMKALRVP